jgi:hypothetical protein
LPDISNPTFIPGFFNPRLLNHDHGGVEKSEVDFSYHLLNRVRTFQPGLFKTLKVEKYMFKKLG